MGVLLIFWPLVVRIPALLGLLLGRDSVSLIKVAKGSNLLRKRPVPLHIRFQGSTQPIMGRFLHDDVDDGDPGAGGRVARRVLEDF